MPDIFGQETPLEVLARTRASVQDSRAAFAKTAGGQSSGGQAGLALGAIFGGTIRKTIDTHQARKSEAERLADEGFSPKEAREMAKQNVPRATHEMRRAKQLQTAAKEAHESIQKISHTVGAEFATYNAKMQYARKLRTLGMHNEASALSTTARREYNTELARLQGVKDAKAQTAATIARTQKTLAETEQVGVTPISKLLNEKEGLIAQIDGEDDPVKQRALNERLALVKQNIHKLNFITGSSETDLLVNGVDLTKPTVNLLQKSLIDAGNQMDLLTGIGVRYDPFFLTVPSNVAVKGLSFMERLNIPIGETGEDFLVRHGQFKASALDGLNRYIKLITGAQMSEAEADRLRKAFPNVEQDSGSQFIGKYVAVVQLLMGVQARARASLEQNRADLLPSDMKAGSGANLLAWQPTAEEAKEFIGLGGVDLSERSSQDQEVESALKLVQDIIDTAEGT